jgi:hypothetical protein
MPAVAGAQKLLALAFAVSSHHAKASIKRSIGVRMMKKKIVPEEHHC